MRSWNQDSASLDDLWLGATEIDGHVCRVLDFPPYLNVLNGLPGIRAAWVGRLPGLEVNVDRSVAMSRLLPWHQQAVAALAEGKSFLWHRAEQVHGAGIALVPTAPTQDDADGFPVVMGVDGLLCGEDGQMLAIHVADCGAIWLVDQRTRAIGLLHSGKKGTEANILGKAVERMGREFGTRPEDLIAVLSPCIRPPDYEVDFAAEIGRQAERAGIGKFIDSGENTACDLSAHYSYRKESGKTGRMMALLYRESV